MHCTYHRRDQRNPNQISANYSVASRYRFTVGFSSTHTRLFIVAPFFLELKRRWRRRPRTRGLQKVRPRLPPSRAAVPSKREAVSINIPNRAPPHSPCMGCFFHAFYGVMFVRKLSRFECVRDHIFTTRAPALTTTKVRPIIINTNESINNIPSTIRSADTPRKYCKNAVCASLSNELKTLYQMHVFDVKLN